jgi:hypothetical protein
MAFNKDICGTAVKDFLLTLTESQKNDPEYIWRGIADVFLSHIANNGDVSITVTGAADLGTGEVTGTGSGGIE